MAVQVPEESSAFTAPALAFELVSGNSAVVNSTPSRIHLHHRSGQLCFSNRRTQQHEQTIETPAIVSHSRRGAVPHLTRDNVARTSVEAVSVPLEHFLDVQPPPLSLAPFGLRRSIGLHESKRLPRRIMTLMSLRDYSDSTILSPSTDDTIYTNSGRGRSRASPREYLDWSLPRPPDILIALADEMIEEKGRSRKIHEASKRSLQWVLSTSSEASKRTSVFAPLVGSMCVKAREKYSKALVGIADGFIAPPPSTTGSTIDSNISGYSLLVPSPSSSASSLLQSTKGLASSAPSIPTLFLASLKPLPTHKPRLVHSAAGPHDILRLVLEVGIDLFVDEWSSRCASLGVGLDFSFPVVNPVTLDLSSSASSALSASESVDIGRSYFSIDYAHSYLPLASRSNLSYPLKEGVSAAFGPTTESTPAPTEAYVHHLLKSHELTSHVILALHNQLIMSNFMSAVRRMLLLDNADGGNRFEREVGIFFATYRQSEAGEFSGGEYSCVREARLACDRVDKERGKGVRK